MAPTGTRPTGGGTSARPYGSLPRSTGCSTTATTRSSRSRRTRYFRPTSTRSCGPAASAPTIVHSLRRGDDERVTLLKNLGKLYTEGVEIDREKLAGSGRFVDLPAYAWEHEPFLARVGTLPRVPPGSARPSAARQASRRRVPHVEVRSRPTRRALPRRSSCPGAGRALGHLLSRDGPGRGAADPRARTADPRGDRAGPGLLPRRAGEDEPAAERRSIGQRLRDPPQAGSARTTVDDARQRPPAPGRQRDASASGGNRRAVPALRHRAALGRGSLRPGSRSSGSTTDRVSD